MLVCVCVFFVHILSFMGEESIRPKLMYIENANQKSEMYIPVLHFGDFFPSFW